MADNACAGFKRTITEIEENNIQETTHQQQEYRKVSFMIDSSSKDQTTPKKVKSSPSESLSKTGDIQELGFHHWVDSVSVTENNREMVDAVSRIVENLGGKFEKAEVLISLEQNQEMVDAAVCENVGTFCDVVKDTEISHIGFVETDFESKKVADSSVVSVQEMVDAAVCEKVGTFRDVMKETETSRNRFDANFATKNRSVVQELKKTDANKNRVGKMVIPHVANGGNGISSSLRFDFNKQLLSQFEVGSSVFGDKTRINKVSGYPRRSIDLKKKKKKNSGQEMYKNVQNKADGHGSNSSLKMEVIDDTALIETILLCKNGNRCVKAAGRISFAKGKEKIGKKIEKQEADGKKLKQLRGKTRVPKKTRQVYIRVEQTKRIYSREKLMALKDIGIVEQQKTWRSIRNGLNPDVANEYDSLVDTKQQKDSSLEFYHCPPQQFRNRDRSLGFSVCLLEEEEAIA